MYARIKLCMSKIKKEPHLRFLLIFVLRLLIAATNTKHLFNPVPRLGAAYKRYAHVTTNT